MPLVLITGCSSGIGRALADAYKHAGYEVWATARKTADVAQLKADGFVAVQLDVNDSLDVDRLSKRIKQHGQGLDVLINNAFRVPSMKPFANTTFEHMRDAIELTVFGALRMTQGFTPALEAAKGAVVNVNSMVVRHSQAKYGAYKMAKSALLAMSQTLSTELGEKGIRVNSVMPGYIWGETLEGYFGHQAQKYGTTVEQIYAASAAGSDLKRLPTEDEVASAILFLASDLSSGITGQSLDVNCGEYKA